VGAGFINPAIYTLGLGPGYGTDFHDITSGSNGTDSTQLGYDLAGCGKRVAAALCRHVPVAMVEVMAT
jgi:xanthomonalisin